MKILKKTLAVLLSLAMVFGTMTVTAFADEYEAKIGDTEYATLADAFAKAKDGNEIELLKDVTVAKRIELSAKAAATATEITLNMNGKRITYTGDNQGVILIRAYTTVIVNGSGELINNPSEGSTSLFSTNSNAKLIIENGTFSGADIISYTSYADTISVTGGTFDIDPAAQKTTGSSPKDFSAVATGYMSVPNNPEAPTSWTVEKDPSAKELAEVDGTAYYSFADALAVVNAASVQKTIKILENFTVDTLGELKENKSLLLDLNGKTITITSDIAIKLAKSKEMILDDTSEGKNGKILGTGGISNNGFIYVNAGNATFTMNAGTVEASGSEGCERGVVWTSGSKNNVVVINGGTVINNGEGFSVAATGNYTPSVAINGGTFIGDFSIGTASSFTISGGLFHFDPEVCGAAILGEVIDNGDGTWTVIPKDFAKLTANGVDVGSYTSFDAAIKAGYENYTTGDVVTVQLLDDTNSPGNIDLSGKATNNGSWVLNAPDITIDLNGHYLGVAATWFIKLKAQLTIDDTSEDQTGYIESEVGSPSNGFIYANSNESLNINGGTISLPNLNSGKWLINSSGFINTVNINGGILDAGAGNAVRTGTNAITVNVTGGTVLGEIAPGAATLTTVSGGYFDNDPSKWVDIDLYKVDTDPDTGYFAVVMKDDLPDIVTVDGKNFKTVGSAINAILATTGKTGTIKFLDDTTLVEGTITTDDLEANITFDLNGKTIQEKKAVQMFLLKSGTFTIKNGTILAGGQIATSGHIRANNATLTVKDIVFDGDKTQKDVLTNINSKNGGAFYLYATKTTFDNTVVKNCLVRDMSAGTGNSGAIHVVKQDVAHVATLDFINGSKIVNCQAAIQGGAVSVGSGCTFTLNEGCSIENCKATMGGAVYIDISDDKNVPAQTDHLCGTADIKGTITGCTSTSEESSAPIYSRGFAYINGSICNDGTNAYQRETVAAIDSINLTLQSDLDMGVFAKFVNKTGDTTAPQLKVTIGDSEKWIAAEEGTTNFKIEGINMAMMANEVKIQVGDGADLFFSNEATTSVVDYAEKALAADSENTKLANLLADMLKLGSETQKYWGVEGSVAFDVADTTLAPYVTSVVPTATDSVKKTTTSASDATNYKISQAAVNIYDKINCFFWILATDTSATVKVTDENGATLFDGTVADLTPVDGVDNTYRLDTDRFSPTEYGTKLTIQLFNPAGTLVHAVNYSINSYCFSEKDDATVSSLVLAIFRANKSALEYVKTPS